MGKHRRSRSRYRRMSDAVFAKTGIPLSRLLSISLVIALVGGLIYYVVKDGNGSVGTAVDAPVTQFDSGKSDFGNFVDAVTVPKDFSKFTYPERIEKLDAMIKNCRHLLTQKNQYADKLKEKLIALHALKCVLLAENGIDPTAEIRRLKNQAAQSAETEAQQDEYHYLLAYVDMATLANRRDDQLYDMAMASINAIRETSLVPPAQAAGCARAARIYFANSTDKAAAGKILKALGTKMLLAKEQKIKDIGLELLDHPNFFTYYEDSSLGRTESDDYLPKTIELLKQIQKTPPQSIETYNVLLDLPEQYLQAGNTIVAGRVLQQINAAAGDVNEVIRQYVLAKIQKVSTRIGLVGNPFPLAGLDVRGTPIEPLKKERTVVIFWNPDEKSSIDALVRVQDSRLYDRWSTELLLVPIAELLPDEIIVLKKKFPTFRFIDNSTSKRWLEISGVNRVPYAITLDGDGIVKRMSQP